MIRAEGTCPYLSDYSLDSTSNPHSLLHLVDEFEVFLLLASDHFVAVFILIGSLGRTQYSDFLSMAISTQAQ